MAIIVSKVLLRDQHEWRKNKIMLLARRRDERIQELNGLIAKQAERLKEWAGGERTSWAAKSLELRHGTIGFREGKNAVKLLVEWTWERVLEALRELRKRARRKEKWGVYIRVKEEINKQQIAADFQARRLSQKDADRFGVTMGKDEHFFCEPKIERAPAS